jgi:hypothetical protein
MYMLSQQRMPGNGKATYPKPCYLKWLEKSTKGQTQIVPKNIFTRGGYLHHNPCHCLQHQLEVELALLSVTLVAVPSLQFTTATLPHHRQNQVQNKWWFQIFSQIALTFSHPSIQKTSSGNTLKQMGINIYTTAHIQDPNQMKRRARATPPMGPSSITNCKSLATSWCSLMMVCSAGVKPWVQIVHTLANNWKTFSFPLENLTLKKHN